MTNEKRKRRSTILNSQCISNKKGGLDERQADVQFRQRFDRLNGAVHDYRCHPGADREYRSIPSYYFINSFEINETGPHKVRIEFVGQKIQNIGLIVSAIIYTACIAYIIYDWKLKIILNKYTR